MKLESYWLDTAPPFQRAAEGRGSVSTHDITSMFPPFPDPAERHPPGSPEWSARVSLRAYSAIGQVRDYAVKRLIEVLRYALPHEPWRTFPEDHPFNDVDAYFEALCGMDLAGILAVVDSVDKEAGRELRAIMTKTPTAAAGT